MKRTTTEAIRNVLWRVYPELRHIWLVDREYDIPPFDLVKVAVEKAGIFTLELHDCDDYSLQAHANVRLRNDRWACGEVIGYLNEGVDIFVHAMNIAITAQGVRFYDAKENKFYKPGELDYKPFFVRM